jgi:hypothetical protein
LAVRRALVLLARPPFELPRLFALELRLVPFAPRDVFALELRLVPFELRLLFARGLLPLPFELPAALLREAPPLLAVDRDLLFWLVVRPLLLRDVPERCVPPPPELFPEAERFVPVALGRDLRAADDVRRAPLPLPLPLPSFDVNASTASRGACTVLRAPLATLAAESPSDGARRRRVMSFPILLTAICATVAAPAPAANPPAAVSFTVETCSEACLRVVPTRRIASPATVAATARAVSLSSTLRAPS